MNLQYLFSQPLMGSRGSIALRLLTTHGISPKMKFFIRAAYVLLASCMVLPLLRSWERWRRNNKISATAIDKAPVFIIGHWRSGTTLLHSLMACDRRFGFMDNRMAFMPNTMLAGQNLIRFLVKIHLLPKRPMDDVKLSPGSPQEEEFALANLFGKGVCLGWYFPKKLVAYFEKYALGEGVSEQEKAAFEAQYQWLIKKTAYTCDGKRLLLKNPANTGRVEMLLRLFPDARFIYLHRDPCEVYFSTLRLHAGLSEQFGLQACDEQQVREFVPRCYRRLLAQYRKDKIFIPEGQLTEIAYSDLTENPMGTLRQIYAQLSLDGFDEAAPAFAEFIGQQGAYRPARYPVSAENRQRICAEMKGTAEIVMN